MKEIRDIPGTCVMQTIRQAARAVTALYEARLRRFELTASQFSALVAIDSASGATVGTLAEHLGMDRTTMSRVLAPLERRGLIANESDREDRRARVPALTDEGRTLLRDAAAEWRQVQRDTLDRLGPEWETARKTIARIG